MKRMKTSLLHTVLGTVEVETSRYIIFLVVFNEFYLAILYITVASIKRGRLTRRLMLLVKQASCPAASDWGLYA